MRVASPNGITGTSGKSPPNFEIKTPKGLYQQLQSLGKNISQQDMQMIEQIGRNIMKGNDSLKFYRDTVHGDSEKKLRTLEKLEADTLILYQRLCKIMNIVSAYIDILLNGWPDKRPVVSINDMIQVINESTNIRRLVSNLVSCR